MKKVLPDFSGMKVLVIGDVMLDQYIYGSVDCISPEAPVPIMLREKTILKAGGAANVALNIRALGAEPILLSCVGKDISGDRLLEVIENDGINTGFILRSEQEITTVKTRLIAGSQHLLRIDEEEILPVNNSLEINLIQSLQEIISHNKINAILVEDYNKGLLTPAFIREIEKVRNEHQIICTVDPKFNNFANYKNFTLLKPNIREVNYVLKSNYEVNLTDLKEASERLRKIMGYTNLMITLGENGVFFDNGTIQDILPAAELEIVDVCGAGDAVISIATLCLIAGMDLQEVVYWSNKAGAEVCRHTGVVAVSRDALVQ